MDSLLSGRVGDALAWGIGGQRLETNPALNRFLMGVERRALRMATLSSGSVDDALDIVQEAMLKLVSRYGRRREEEWGPLFQRILQNTLTDWHRRSWVRNRWRQLVAGGREDEPADPVGALADQRSPGPDRAMGDGETMEALEEAIRQLPLRQQQAFMLRLWEGLNVARTAQAMGCSEGSVKTHYSRAVNSLRGKLEGYWP